MGSPNRIEYRVTARNAATASENRLHTDDVARRYGFCGGLVPGGTVYAYATYPVVQVLGERWLAHGRARVRFVSPCYDGEDLTVTVVAGTSASVDFEARAGGRICAAGSASLISASSPGEEVDAIPATVYAEQGLLHPGLLLEGANNVLMASLALPAWLHVESDVRHLRAVSMGEEVEVRARVAELFERKGHRFVRLDVISVSGPETVATTKHTPIW